MLIWTGFIVIARGTARLNLLPLDIVWLRLLGAAVLLVPWGIWLVYGQRVRTASWFASPLPWRQTAVVGMLGGVLYAVLAYSGFIYAPAAHASILMPGTLPLSTALVAWLLLYERPSRQRLMGLALIVVGDVLVGGFSIYKALTDPSAAPLVWLGDLLFLAASSTWAVYAVTVRRWQLNPVYATTAIVVFCALTFLPLYALLAYLRVIPSLLGSAPLGEMAFQAVFQGWGSVVISGITFNVMVKHYGPTRSTLITALVPSLSALGAVIFLSEPLTANLIAGLVAVTAGILLGVRASTGRAGGTAQLGSKPR